MKATIVQDKTGCKITDSNWDEKILKQFLEQGWKIQKEKKYRYCGCGNQLITEEEQRDKICRDCK